MVAIHNFTVVGLVGLILNGEDGVTVVGGTGCKVKDNFLMENGWQTDDEYRGLYISAMTDVSIYHNSIINSTNQVYVWVPSSVNWTGRWNVTGNYWSDYTGDDADGDGIGEDPYVINTSTYETKDHKDYFPFMNPYLPGDINHDGKVDMRDISTIARAYGTTPEDENWNPKADLYEDGFIDMTDINIATENFGKTWQDFWGIE